VYYARPTSSFGYYRGNPVFTGEGAGQGQNVSGANVFSAGQGTDTTAGGTSWSPTILYMFVLILIEMFIFAFIARKL
jgi:hypothetical protein